MGATRDRWVLPLFRILCYCAIAALVIVSALTSTFGPLKAGSARLSDQIRSDNDRIAGMQEEIDALLAQWVGIPALWQQPPAPANTTMHFFPVSGSTQRQLLLSIEDADICSHYGPCAVDPAVPNGFALGLEGDGGLHPNGPYCYSPRTLAYHWTRHEIIMPRWDPKPGSVTTKLVQRWNDLEQVIFTHESGHVRVAEAWLSHMNQESRQLPTCGAAIAFWSNPHLFDSLETAQNAYHAQLRADCRPEVGCIPPAWEGWS